MTKSATLAKARYLKDRSTSLKNGGLEKINEMIQELTFDEVVVFLQDKVRQAVKEIEEDIKPKSKKKIDSRIMNKLHCLMKENKRLRNENIKIRDNVVKSKTNIRNIQDNIQNEEMRISELREKLLKLKKKKIEMDYMIEANQLKEFVSQTQQLERDIAKCREENESQQIFFKEDARTVEIKGENGIYFHVEKPNMKSNSGHMLVTPVKDNLFSSVKNDMKERFEKKGILRASGEGEIGSGRKRSFVEDEEEEEEDQGKKKIISIFGANRESALLTGKKGLLGSGKSLQKKETEMKKFKAIDLFGKLLRDFAKQESEEEDVGSD